MQSSEFLRCLDDLSSLTEGVKPLAVAQLHVLIFGYGTDDPEQARGNLRQVALRLVEVLAENKP